VLPVLDQNIKQRLIGAAVLIVVGIIVIPFLLREPAEVVLRSENDEHYRTREDFLSAIEVLPDRQEDAALVSTARLLPEQNKQDLPNLTDSDPEEKIRPLSLPKEPASFIPSEFSEQEVGWLIQIGSFSHKENALRMRDEVASSGYRAFIETEKNRTKTIYKVRVGPERNVVGARDLKQKLEHQLQTKVFIISPSDDGITK
jgi:DedD protein